jgi:CheY-like chemotaxis protein
MRGRTSVGLPGCTQVRDGAAHAMLEDAGFTVIEAACADEAWEILESRSDIGVLFTDIEMPGSMNGFALAARVAERWPHIRLVI